MIIENNSKLVIIGDSVTDCGRQRDSSEGRPDAMGGGYVNMIFALLNSVYPEKKIRVINKGCSGDTVRDLKSRWQQDVFDLEPDWLSIMIGINDVWRQYDLPGIKEEHVYLDEYEETLESLVSKTLPKVKGMILMTPYFMEPLKGDAMRATMDQYGAVVKKIADKYNTIFIDTQAVFDKLFENFHSAAVAWDRIHPNPIGHMAIARAFLNAIGFEWE